MKDENVDTVKEEKKEQETIKNDNKDIKNKYKLKTRYKILIFFIIVLIGCLGFRYIQKDLFFYPWNDTLSHRQLKKYTDFVEVNIMNEEEN